MSRLTNEELLELEIKTKREKESLQKAPAGKPFPQIREKFLSRTDRDGQCWLWKGSLSTGGYGMFYGVPGTNLAHRAAYILFRGKIPKGLLACHICDVRKCVNPDHLFLGTFADNNRDMARKGRSAQGEKNGGSRVTESVVQEIFRLRQKGVSVTEIGRALELSSSQVYRTLTGENWKQTRETFVAKFGAFPLTLHECGDMRGIKKGTGRRAKIKEARRG